MPDQPIITTDNVIAQLVPADATDSQKTNITALAEDLLAAVKKSGTLGIPLGIQMGALVMVGFGMLDTMRVVVEDTNDDGSPSDPLADTIKGVQAQLDALKIIQAQHAAILTPAPVAPAAPIVP